MLGPPLSHTIIMAGKGSRPRPVDVNKWRQNYDNIKFQGKALKQDMIAPVSEEFARAFLGGAPVKEKVGITMGNISGITKLKFDDNDTSI